MPRTRRSATLIAATLALSVTGQAIGPAPAAAQSARAPDRSKRAESAARLNAAKASDGELSAAARTLTSQVDAQIKRVNAAKRASAAADAQAAAADSALEATRARIAGLQGAVKAHAIDTYMRPQGRERGFDSRDLATSSRQQALMRHVEKKQVDVIDELQAARQDQEIRSAIAARARDRATQRKRETISQLSGLTRDLRDKARVTGALEARIRLAESEDNAAIANEGSIVALLSTAGDPGVVSRAGMVWPVNGRLTSGFGRRWGRLHAGIDVAAPRGTPIKAARAGKVVFSGWMGGYGNAVIVNHGDVATLYAHQSRRAASVGDVVEQGEVIGYVGSTGRSTGNHLHFETRVGGKAQNPRRFLP